MATELTAEFGIQLKFNHQKTFTGVGQPSIIADRLESFLSFEDGTGTDEANELYVAERTLAANTAETLDLYGGLTNLLGDTINAAKVKGMVIVLEYDATDQASSITFGAAVADQFVGPAGADTDTHTIRNGSWWGWADHVGYAVANGSTDKILITNNDLTVDAVYLIGILLTK